MPTWNGTRKKFPSAHTVSSRRAFILESRMRIRRFMIPILISTNYIYLGSIEEAHRRGTLRKSRRRTNSVWATALKL